MKTLNNMINMYFATHKTCNLSCKYCYVPEYNRFVKKVSDEDILATMAQFTSKFEQENYLIGAFCFHGSEASLMSPETMGEAIVLMNNYWDRTGISGYDVAIQSNGKRLDEDYLNKVLYKTEEPKKLRIGFSIDPPKQVHDLLRNKTYDDVMENYNRAIKMGFPVSVLSVVSKDTMKYLDEFGDWMAEQLENNQKFGNPYKVKIKLATGQMALSEDEIFELSNFLIERNLISLPQMFTPGYCIHDGNECEWYEFDLDGNCYSCNKAYNDDGVFANWKQEPLNEIIGKRKILYQNVIRHVDCSSCEFESLCNSGCPIDRYKTGVMAGKAHECSMIKKVYRHIINNSNLHITDFYNIN
jgi:radical SAM protein with 4Fe4S-binding SPASM domain